MMGTGEAFAWYPLTLLYKVDVSITIMGGVVVRVKARSGGRVIDLVLPETVTAQLTYIAPHSLEQCRQWINAAAERAGAPPTEPESG